MLLCCKTIKQLVTECAYAFKYAFKFNNILMHTIIYCRLVLLRITNNHHYVYDEQYCCNNENTKYKLEIC